MKSIYKIKTYTSNNNSNKKILLPSIIFFVIGIILILNNNIFIGIIMLIVGFLLLLISFFSKNIHYKTIVSDNLDENTINNINENLLNNIEQQMNTIKEHLDLDDIPNEDWTVTEKTYSDNGFTAHYIKKEFYTSTNNLNSTLSKQDYKRIIQCPNCGADNLVEEKIGKCNYCDSFIE